MKCILINPISYVVENVIVSPESGWCQTNFGNTYLTLEKPDDFFVGPEFVYDPLTETFTLPLIETPPI